MTQLDDAVFLVVGAVGAFYDQRVAFGLLGLWGLLKLVHVL